MTTKAKPRLRSHVIVMPEPDSGQTVARFGPDDDVPEWAAAQMGAHCFEGGKHPYGAPADTADAEPADTVEDPAKHKFTIDSAAIAKAVSANLADQAPVAEPEPVVEPPRAGPAASRAAWVAYADSLDLDVVEDASRDEIIASLIGSGHIKA